MKIIKILWLIVFGVSSVAIAYAQQPVSFDREISRLRDLDKEIAIDLKGGIEPVATAQKKLASQLKEIVEAKKSGKEVPDAVNVLSDSLGEIVNAHKQAIKKRGTIERKVQEQCNTLQESIIKIRQSYSPGNAKLNEGEVDKTLKDVATLAYNETNPIWKKRYATIFKALKDSSTGIQKSQLSTEDFRWKMQQKAVVMLENLLSGRLQTYVKIKLGFDDLTRNYAMYQTLYEVAKNLKAGRDLEEATNGTIMVAGTEGVDLGSEDILTAIGDTLEKNMTQLTDNLEGSMDSGLSDTSNGALDEEIRKYAVQEDAKTDVKIEKGLTK